MSSTIIIWLRSDLRLADNPDLDHASEHQERIVPVFIRDPDAEGNWLPGAASRWWLHHSLGEPDERLRKRSSRGHGWACPGGGKGGSVAPCRPSRHSGRYESV